MFRFRARGALVAAALGALLAAGCSDQSGDAAQQQVPAKQFSAQDKRVAAALSLGNESGIDETLSPADRARLCRYLISDLEGLLRRSGSLTSELEQGFDLAKQMYDRRVEANGGGASGASLAEGKTESERARMALTCVRALET